MFDALRTDAKKLAYQISEDLPTHTTIEVIEELIEYTPEVEGFHGKDDCWKAVEEDCKSDPSILAGLAEEYLDLQYLVDILLEKAETEDILKTLCEQVDDKESFLKQARNLANRKLRKLKKVS